MLRISQTKQKDELTLKLEGRLAGPWVGELDRSWHEVRSAAAASRIRIDLCGVSYIDAAGKVLLTDLRRQGARFLVCGCLNQAIVAEIEEAVPGPRRQAKAKSRRKAPPIIFWTLLLSAFLPASLRAQEKTPAAPPAESAAVRLTLDRAVALALRENPQVQIALLSAAQSEEDRSIARAGLLPQAQLTVTDAVRRGNLAANIGRNIPGTPQHVGPFQVFQGGAQFGIPLLDLTLWRRWQAAREGAHAAGAQSQSVREQVVLLVVSQYLGSLRAAADVRAAESRVALAQALYRQAADLQKEGVGTGIDTLRANVQLQNEKQRLLEAEAARRTAIFGLVRLLNLDPRQSVELDDELNFFAAPGFALEESLERAFAARPEMKALEARARAAGFQKRAASESRLPVLRADGIWGYSGITAPTAIPSYQYQASLNMPLFTGGRIHAEIGKADLELRKIDRERDDLRNQIAFEVKSAIVSLDAARNEVEVANLGVQLAKEEVAQARDRFQAGVANNIEVVSAQDALARANDNQIAALYRYNQARADLARAAGEMEKMYAK